MAEVKWIKIVTDIFDDEKILLIESLPSSDNIIVIWFKLLCFAGKSNNNGVFMLNNRIAYTDEMLATIFRKDINTVRMALNTLEDFGMIERVNNVITIPNWDKHQTLDAYEKKKERDRLYQQKRREKQKLLVEGKESSDNQTTLSSDVAVSDKDIDKEEDIEYIDLTRLIDSDVVNVKITKEQYNKLIDKFGKDIVTSKILKFNEWIVYQKNKNKRNHYLTINNWCREESKKQPKNNKPMEKKLVDMF